MGSHIVPGFIFDSTDNNPNGSCYITIDSLNQLVGDAQIHPNAIEDQPVKTELKPLDKFLILDAFTKSLQQLETRHLFHNTRLTGETRSSLPNFNDCSDRVVTTKYLNLLFGNITDNNLINAGLTLFKTAGYGDNGREYAINNYNSSNPNKYLIFVNGINKEFTTDYTIDDYGVVCFHSPLSTKDTYLFLTLNNSKSGSSFFKKFNQEIIADNIDLLEIPTFSDSNLSNYLVFINGLLIPVSDFNIQNETIAFKNFLEPGCFVTIYNLPNNCNNSYFECSNFLSEPDILKYSLPVAISKREEDYMVFIDGRIMIPCTDYVVDGTFITFAKKIPSDKTITVYALINNNNFSVLSKVSDNFNSFKQQVELISTDSIKIKHYISDKPEDYLVFINYKLQVPNRDYNIKDGNILLTNYIPTESSEDVLGIVNIVNKQSISVSASQKSHFEKISAIALSDNIFKLNKSVSPERLLVFEKGLIKTLNTDYSFISSDKLQFVDKTSANNIFLLELTTPDENYLYNIPSIPLHRISTNEANDGDVVFYNKKTNQLEFRGIKETFERETNQPSSSESPINFSINNISFDETKFEIIETGIEKQITLKRIKLSDIDKTNVTPNHCIKFNGKFWYTGLSSLKISSNSNKQSSPFNIEHLIFDEEFELNEESQRLRISFPKKINTTCLHYPNTTENEVLTFKDGQFVPTPINAFVPQIIPIYKDTSLIIEHVNNILISNIPQQLSITIPCYKDVLIDIGAKITIIQADEGIIEIVASKDVEIICTRTNLFSTKKGCKLELIKLTHRKWLLTVLD